MPEDNKVNVSPEEQMGELHRELAGHPVFGRLRGKLAMSLDDILERRRQGLSPTQAREDARQFGADLAWAQGILARLRRDGYTVAEYELRRALASSWHMMFGETTPVEKIVPITFVMYRPDGTLPLFEWLVTNKRRDNDFRLAAKNAKGANPGLVTFFNALPNMRELCQNASVVRSEGFWKMLREYRREAGTEIDQISKQLTTGENGSLWRLCGCEMLCGLHGRKNFSTPSARVCLGWVFRYSQKEVLSAIPRAKQSCFATWQIDLPQMYDHEFDGFAGFGMEIGLHPESEHALWKSRYPALVSHGVQHGYGAIVMPHGLHGYSSRDEETQVRYDFLGSRIA